MRGALLRPAVHAGVLGFAFLEPVLGSRGMAAAAFAALLANAFLLPRTALGRALRREGELRWNGQLSYPLAVALAFLLFRPSVAVLSWAVMALGDPAALLVGTSRPWKARIPWNRRKSVAGSVAFVGAAWAGGLAVTWAIHARSGDDGALWVALAGAAALAGALVETIPLPVDDNLPVPLAAGGVVSLLAPGP